VSRRQEAYGPNELRESPPPTLWARLWDQFKSFVVLLLVAASLLSLFLGDYVEAAAILAIVILNAVLGIFQESRAEAALASLRKLSAPAAQVVRGGQHLDVPARQIVPGDVVILTAGQYVPADVRLVASANLRVDESPLTGESVPAEKHSERELLADCPVTERINMAYLGTVVTYGRGLGLVVATGMETEIGRIARLIQAEPVQPTPLQEKLDELGRSLSLIALALCALVFVGGVLRHFNWLDMLLIAVSLAIAAVPEGLPAVVTLSLALGMREMIRRNAIIRRLPAVETLGATTIVCTDKTGTLTQNAMTAVRAYANDTLIDISGQGYTPSGEFTRAGRPLTSIEHRPFNLLLWGAMLCNDGRLEADEAGHPRPVGDPTEVALLVAAAKAGFRREDEQRLSPRLDEIPFDSARQMMSTFHQYGSSYHLWTKGAPEAVLSRSSNLWRSGETVPLTAALRQHWQDVAHELARDGLRVLAVAHRDSHFKPLRLTPEFETDLTLVGLIGLADPARPEVRPALARAREAGVRTLMVTGDQPLTALRVAQQAGLTHGNPEALRGAEIEALVLPELADRLDHVDVIARATPAHKLKIVEALQSQGHIVAMTGDGVNDAPALRRADVGVAMGLTGTDVAKAAADIVLADDNYASIVAAIEQGRVVYANIRKFVYYLLSCNVAEIAALFIGTLAGWPPVLTAVQLLWLNLITDGAPALALGLEKGEPDIMRRPPRRRTEPIIDRRMIVGIIVQTVVLTAVTLAAYRLGRLRYDIDLAETMAFVTLSSAELLRAYTARSERHPLWRLGLFTNPYMQYAVGTSVALLLLVVYLPVLQPVFNTTALGVRDWAALAPLIAAPALAAEGLKWLLSLRERVA
jgi:Ca2+-transporting ATPase